MISSAPLLLGLLVALLVGLAAGKAWERYKLREGRWIDRRKTRESPHFILGLNSLVAGQIDAAIDELAAASRLDPDALEIHMILGNLYREKGQVGRAIQVHQGLLQRQKLRKLELAYIHLCLGLDYRGGGFVDRAVEAFQEVLRLDPQNEHALLNLEKLYEEQHQWEEAQAIRQRLATVGDTLRRPNDSTILAFLENELGVAAMKRGDLPGAARHFQDAIELDATVVPAHLHLGDVRLLQAQHGTAIAAWEKAVEVSPDRAYLAFERLEREYAAAGAPDRFPELCRRLVAANPQDWRARVALAQHLSARMAHAEALDLLLNALVTNPHAMVIHQRIWRVLAALQFRSDLVGRYMALARDAVFYQDPQVCTRCRYRSTELLWQCPHCHEWNSFVEERIAPAKDDEELKASSVE
jgi:lipopolysaccharide biosynthesis regulator YciM